MTETEGCRKCQGTGWLLDDSVGAGRAVRCECWQKRRNGWLAERAAIPKRYAQCSFENFDVLNDSLKHALKISQKFVKNYPAQDVGMLFIGPCGVGKTHLAVAILNELIKSRNAFCHFCDFRELIKNIQNTYNQDSTASENEILSPVFQSDVLVLDELGAKRTSAWVEETVFYIINHRYNHKRLTIFTSNYLDQEEDEPDNRSGFFKQKDDSLIDRIGVRLRSRIYEMCKVVEIIGEDYRRNIKQGSHRF